MRLEQPKEWYEKNISHDNQEVSIGKKNILLELLEHFPNSIALEMWLAKPNPAFNNRKPQELLDSGDLEPLRAMIHVIKSGEPT